MSSHDRNQEFSYDADDLIKASKYERNFGTGWNGWQYNARSPARAFKASQTEFKRRA